MLTTELSTNVIYGGPVGEGEMLVDSQIRLVAASKSRDDVGDDLNHIVHLIMSEIRFPSNLSHTAVLTYMGRMASYGSYLDAYTAQYGGDMVDLQARMDKGIATGWPLSASPIYGAVKWYHRPGIGANPQLATLYAPIIAVYFKVP